MMPSPAFTITPTASPGRFNRLCTTARLVGATEQQQILEESSIRKAIAELEQT
jgi:hypothetical protein